ncbi:MAG: hypothetical protein JWQ09_4688 [Segetibacter sp.]|nr:hypothetical protein [Segetibacter sp.]
MLWVNVNKLILFELTAKIAEKLYNYITVDQPFLDAPSKKRPRSENMWLKKGITLPSQLITFGPKGSIKEYVCEAAWVSVEIKCMRVAKNKMTLYTIRYITAYKTIPAKASIQPRKTILTAFFTRDAPHRIKNTTATNTIRKERNGSQ